jgi:hypothetical protein
VNKSPACCITPIVGQWSKREVCFQQSQSFVIIFAATCSATPNYLDCLCSVQAFTLPPSLLFDVA